MSLFTTNYENVSENTGNYGPLPTGEYEAIIVNVEEKTTPNDKVGMNFSLVIRNDLSEVPTLKDTNGKYGNRYVFTTEWKRNKDGGYKYEMENFMHYLSAVQIPEGTEVKDLDHLVDLLTLKPVRVYIKEEENTYNGNTEMINTIAPWGFKPTEFPNVNHEWKKKVEEFKENNDTPNNPFANTTNNVNTGDDDLPF